MNKNLKRSRDIAYLRQLCCSGLDYRLVITEFLNAVRQVIPSSTNTFSVLANNNTQETLLFSYVPPEIVEYIFEISTNYWTPQRFKSMISILQSKCVLRDQRVLDPYFFRSDFYNYCFLPMEQHQSMVTTVYQHGIPVGFFGLFRPAPRYAKDFNNEEEALMLRLLPYITHAATSTEVKEKVYCGNGTTGMMIMDNQGVVLYQSQTAKKLLNFANYPFITADAPSQKAAMMAKLAQICRNLDTIFKGKEAAPPSWCHVNGRGRFIFRAQWLDSENREQGKLIGMTIEHQEPQLLKILRALQDTPLSPVQKEVAVLLAQGASNEKICQHLHIKPTTVKDHCRKIYARLDIETREQLLPLLLEKEKTNRFELNW